jgi:hypothetical protein
MTTITTLGKHKTFQYSGSVATGVTLHFHKGGTSHVSADFFRVLLRHFKGQTVQGGFNMTDPTPGGFGEWIQYNSLELNGSALTPRHGSFIAAILVHEGYCSCILRGNAVYLKFKD